MKRLPLLLFLLTACQHQPASDPAAYWWLQPKDLIQPEYYYLQPDLTEPAPEILASWQNRKSWYKMAIFHDDPHGAVRVSYDDSLHLGFPDILTTSDSVRYYDSIVGHPSSAVIPEKGGALTKKIIHFQAPANHDELYMRRVR